MSRPFMSACLIESKKDGTGQDRRTTKLAKFDCGFLSIIILKAMRIADTIRKLKDYLGIG